jgi:hypothetical protein
MAGTIVANTINTDTGLFSTNNAYQGIANAWVDFNGSTSTINASFNVSSITKNGTGDYNINFTSAFVDNKYAVVASCGTTGTDANSQFWVWQKDTGNRTASTVRLVSTQHGTAGGWSPNPSDVTTFDVVVHR